MRRAVKLLMFVSSALLVGLLLLPAPAVDVAPATETPAERRARVDARMAAAADERAERIAAREAAAGMAAAVVRSGVEAHADCVVRLVQGSGDFQTCSEFVTRPVFLEALAEIGENESLGAVIGEHSPAIDAAAAAGDPAAWAAALTRYAAAVRVWGLRNAG